MQKILIAADGSPSGHKAVELGLDLASRLGAAAVVLHADEQLSKRLFEEDPANGPTQEQLVEHDAVLRQAANVAQMTGVDLELELVGEHGTGGIADAIVGVANGIGADLIVMGSRGHGSLAGAIIGSVSRGVLENASQPVLVARAEN